MFCTVRIDVCSVTCPGVRMRQGGFSEIYLTIDLFDRCLFTRSLQPEFPLRFDESFEIFKCFPHFADTAAINTWLQGERVWVKLFASNLRGFKVLLASHQSSAWDFIFPSFSKFPTFGYSGEIFLHPSHHFLGHIYPKLVFSTWTCMGQLTTGSKRQVLDDCAVNLSVVNRMLSCKGIICAKDFQRHNSIEYQTSNTRISKYSESNPDQHNTSDTQCTAPAVIKVSTGTQWEPPVLDVGPKDLSHTGQYKNGNLSKLNYSSHLSHWRRRFGLYPAVTQREAQLVHVAVDPQILT